MVRELAGLGPASALLPWASVVGGPEKGHHRVQLGQLSVNIHLPVLSQNPLQFS